MSNLLDVKNLKTAFTNFGGQGFVLNNISFSVAHGEAVGIAGESGSGKSVTMLSIMRLLAENCELVDGEILFDGCNLRDQDDKAMQSIRGNKIGMIFQDPMTSLNPVLSIGYQVMEVMIRHKKMPKAAARQKTIDMLKLVGIPDPKRCISMYPYELSGGMIQRVMIAMAVCCEPELLIADEPTTALDVTIQAQILELMKKFKIEKKMSIIFVTHDLRLIADICDRAVVMYGGTIVEKGKVDDLFYNPAHPYTIGLINCIPDTGADRKHLKTIEGKPYLSAFTTGCPFHARCSHAMEICGIERPGHTEINEGHEVACWLIK